MPMLSTPQCQNESYTIPDDHTGGHALLSWVASLGVPCCIFCCPNPKPSFYRSKEPNRHVNYFLFPPSCSKVDTYRVKKHVSPALGSRCPCLQRLLQSMPQSAKHQQSAYAYEAQVRPFSTAALSVPSISMHLKHTCVHAVQLPCSQHPIAKLSPSGLREQVNNGWSGNRREQEAQEEFKSWFQANMLSSPRSSREGCCQAIALLENSSSFCQHTLLLIITSLTSFSSLTDVYGGYSLPFCSVPLGSCPPASSHSPAAALWLSPAAAAAASCCLRTMKLTSLSETVYSIWRQGK